MGHAQRCPICFGSGKVDDEATQQTTCPQKRSCHGCGGKGWISVHDYYEKYGSPVEATYHGTKFIT